MISIKPAISRKIIFRVPRFPLDATLGECWEELKSAIAISSPSFYEQVASVPRGGIADLPRKVRHTVDKYFNRAKYRPVPYGFFASVGLIDPQPSEHHAGIVIGGEPVLHRYVDWPVKDSLGYTIEDVLSSGARLFANSSYYLVGTKLRYLFRGGDAYELTEVEPSAGIFTALRACRRPVEAAEVIGLLGENGRDLVEGMIAAQLLYTSLDPNMTGEDYFERRGIAPTGLPSYDLLEQPYLRGILPVPVQRSITAAIRKLCALVPPAPVAAELETFIRRFEMKYDRREVPIMEALDPQLGIGYGNFEEAGGTLGAVAQLAAGRAEASGSNGGSRELLGKVTSAFTGKGGTLQLSELLTGDGREHPPLPNTFSALVTCCDGLVKLEYAGGPSATLLAGRFTLAGDGIAGAAAELAAVEQDANPGVLFFDIAYQAEVKADNVNRRRHVYSAQLSIGSYDTSPNPLSLEDILVSVRGGQLVLRSRDLGKRLVPRMASAYNHRRSDLSLFRLLSDLQYQGVHCHFDLDLQALLPGLDRYPRVQEGTVVVCAAKWRVAPRAIRDRDPAKLRAYLAERGASGFLKFGPADLKLCFDLDNDSDLAMMLEHWKPGEEIYVEEAFIPSVSLVKDELGRPYYCQFLLSLAHGNPIYEPLPKPPAGADEPAFFAPGSRWLYWEIYGHPAGADQLLTGEIRSFLERNRSSVKKWFFIRYDDNGPHLRLRVEADHIEALPRLITGMRDTLLAKLGSKELADLQLKTYRRELERYGATNIKVAENYFDADSRYVLELLSRGFSDIEKYHLFADLVSGIRALGIMDQEQFKVLAEMMHSNLFREHGGGAAAGRLLNRVHSEFLLSQVPVLPGELLRHRAAAINLLRLLLLGSGGITRRYLLADLLHMHLNRLFADHQRTQELICYHLLLREWTREAALARATGV